MWMQICGQDIHFLTFADAEMDADIYFQFLRMRMLKIIQISADADADAGIWSTSSNNNNNNNHIGNNNNNHNKNSSNISIVTRQVLGRPVCDRGAIPRTLVQSNVLRSRLIILINEEINEANWMVSNSAKLDRRTKQHTQFGVSASNGSRDMARTKSWRKKIKKNKIK